MKKMFSLLLCLLLLCSMIPSVPAAGDVPKITMQPQNYHYPEYSVAIYTVKVSGSNLHATWYLEYEGTTYTLSDNQNPMEPWEAYAGESYGPIGGDSNTFGWFFGGIEAGLNGAEIWCVIEDGHYDVTSARAVITVQGSAMPPEILDMPAECIAKRGETAELRCISRSVDESQLTFQWYETATGRLQDVRAIEGEDCDFFFCDTSKVGTRYYVCCVTSDAGGMVYSGVLPVTVTDEVPTTGGTPPQFVTESLPQAIVGSAYSFLLESTDPLASYCLWYNPGKANDFEKTGLVLNEQGLLSGTPATAGSYTFTICAANTNGEDYREFTLTVAEPAEPSTAEPTESTQTTTQTTTATPPATTTESATTAAPTREEVPKTEAAQPSETPEDNTGFPWWGYLLLVLGGITAGIGISYIFINQTLRRK